MASIRDITDMTDRSAELLRGAGIHTLEQLLETGATSTGRMTLADEAAPTLVNVRTQDQNANGKIDGIVLSFSENVSGNDAGWTIDGLAAGKSRKGKGNRRFCRIDIAFIFSQAAFIILNEFLDISLTDGFRHFDLSRLQRIFNAFFRRQDSRL